MAHRAVLTARQRASLFDLPTEEAALLQHYTLADEDIEHIRTRRRPQNQIGFTLQLCALRYPGRLLKPGEVIPDAVSRFLAAQLGLTPDDLLPYAAREKTRRDHLVSLRKIYGYRMCKGKRAKQMPCWLDQHAEAAQSNEGLVRGFVEECRKRRIILPGLTVVERDCADALVVAERRVVSRIAARLDGAMCARLDADVPDEAGDLVLDLYRRLPEARITDILMEVDDATGFTEAFTHLRTGAPCRDRIGLLSVILAEGLNLGLSKMANATNTHDYFQLSRLSRWHIESESLNRALAMVLDAQAQLPMAQFWGAGQTASSDGQFFPTARQGEAMNLINAKYGSEPGLKAYTHVSDQYGVSCV